MNAWRLVNTACGLLGQRAWFLEGMLCQSMQLHMIDGAGCARLFGAPGRCRLLASAAGKDERNSSTSQSRTVGADDEPAQATGVHAVRMGVATEPASTLRTMQPSDNLADDAVITRLILAAGTLREVEILLSFHGRRFRSIHVAQLLTRLPVVEMQGPDCASRRLRIVSLMCQGLLDTCNELNGPSLAACLWALGRIGYAVPGTLHALLEDLLSNGAAKAAACQFSQLANVAWSIAKLQALHGSAAVDSRTQVRLFRERCHDARRLESQAHHQLAKLEQRRVVTERMWQVMARLAAIRINQATGDDLSRMAWAYAAASRPESGTLFTAVAAQALNLCRLHPPPAAPSIMLAHRTSSSSADAEHAASAVFHGENRGRNNTSSASQVLLDTGDLHPLADSVATTVRSAAMAPVAPRALKALPREKGLTAQAITNLAWAFAMVGHRNDHLFEALAAAAIPQKASLDPASLATLAWAFAAFDLHHADLMVAIAKKACRRIRYFTAEQLSRLFWAFASLRHHDADLMHRMQAGLQQTHENGTKLQPREACNMMWALMRLQPMGQQNHPPRSSKHTSSQAPVLQMLLPVLLHRAPGSLLASDLANAVWSLGVAAAAQPAAAVSAAASGKLSQHSSDAGAGQSLDSSQDVRMHIWDLLPGFLTELADIPTSAFSDSELVRLHSADLLLRQARRTASEMRRVQAMGSTEMQGTCVGKLLQVGKQDILDISYVGQQQNPAETAHEWYEGCESSFLPAHICRAAVGAVHAAAGRTLAKASLRVGGSAAPWTRDVMLTAEDMGYEPVCNVPALGGACMVDVALATPSGQIAIQCDGPERLTRSLPYTDLGDAVIQQRLLHVAGWRVVSIPKHVWLLWEGREEQLMFLYGLLIDTG